MCPSDRVPSPLQNLLPSWDIRMVSELRSPAALEQDFHLLDRDGDGELGSADLLNFFTESMHQRMSQEEAQAMVSAADLSGKGTVSLSEFRCLVGDMRVTDTAIVEGIYAEADAMAVLCEAFGALDVDKDGLISSLDLRNALPSSVFSDLSIDNMITAEGNPIEFQSFVELAMMPCPASPSTWLDDQLHRKLL